MSSSQEAPALIQYACERCKTRFVLPPSSRKLSIAGKFRAFSMGVGRAFKFHEGLGAGYDTSRRQLLAKMDDEAYQSFVQSFRFCHECRQFVCNECWSTSRRSCLTCVAKSMTGTVRPRPPFAPTGPEIPRPVVSALQVPRKGRLRRDAALVALALAIVLVSLEAGILIVGATGGTTGNVNATPTITASPTPGDTATESPSQTDSATPSPTDTPTATLTATASASASASASATATARRTAGPTGTPAGSQTPTPVPAPGSPVVFCSWSNGGTAPADLSCHITGGYTYLAGDTLSWTINGPGSVGNGLTLSYHSDTGGDFYVQLFVTRSTGTSNSIAIDYVLN